MAWWLSYLILTIRGENNLQALANASSIITSIMFITYIVSKIIMYMSETHDNHIVYIKEIGNDTDIGEPDFYLGEKSDLSCTIKIKFDVPLKEIILYGYNEDIKFEDFIVGDYSDNQYSNMKGKISCVPRNENIFIEARMIDICALDCIEYTTYDFKKFRYYIYSNGKNGSYNRGGAKFKPTLKSVLASVIK